MSLVPSDLVAAAFLRTAADTKTSRTVVNLLAAGDARSGYAWLEGLAEELSIPLVERGATIERALARADSAIERAGASGIDVVTLAAADYPPWLRSIADPPLVLWTMGKPLVALADSVLVAVVGSRRATPGGLAMARRLARDLASADLVVVSGLARGIDGAAHQGALDERGTTVAVLGSGVDVIYPREHVSLSRAIMATGTIVSELPPGSPPLASHFPLRNRIISGLSRAVVIVEASEKSGSLITARMGLEQGRDVLAVPGSVASGCYRGCHGLIKDGARLVETVDDILEEIGGVRRQSRRDKANKYSGLDALVRRGEAVGLDEIALRTTRPVEELLAELGRQEVAGRIGRIAGGAFIRLD